LGAKSRAEVFKKCAIWSEKEELKVEDNKKYALHLNNWLDLIYHGLQGMKLQIHWKNLPLKRES
jgi:hypothetical protein